MRLGFAEAHRDVVLTEGKVQLDRLEAMRKFFVKARALSLAQRELLYAKDELEMCTMRMRVRLLSSANSCACEKYVCSLFHLPRL